MKTYQPMSTGNIRPFLFSLVVMTALSLVPMLSHATLFWDDEMEEGTTGFNYQPNFDNGAFTYDTTVKFSGSGSIRMNFPANCEPATFGGNGCGGGLSRTTPPTVDLFKRVYFRMSGKAGTPNPTPSGLFQTSISTFTKLLRTVSNGNLHQWWVMGCCTSKNWMVNVENVPIGHAFNVFSNKTLANDQWYCLETRERMNTPGAADGILQSWVDGVLVMNRTDIPWRLANEGSVTWTQVSIFRQTARGSVWWDRHAAGDQRIGCIGATSVSDTTRPAPPQELVIK